MSGPSFMILTSDPFLNNELILLLTYFCFIDEIFEERKQRFECQFWTKIQNFS